MFRTFVRKAVDKMQKRRRNKKLISASNEAPPILVPPGTREIAASSQCSQIISKSRKLPGVSSRYIFAAHARAYTHSHTRLVKHTDMYVYTGHLAYTRTTAHHVSGINGGLSTRSGMKLRGKDCGTLELQNSREHNFSIVCSGDRLLWIPQEAHEPVYTEV